MCTATKSISKSGNMSCYQHVAHARLATLARALSHSLTLKPGSAHRLTRLHACAQPLSLSLYRSPSLALLCKCRSLTAISAAASAALLGCCSCAFLAASAHFHFRAFGRRRQRLCPLFSSSLFAASAFCWCSSSFSLHFVKQTGID